MGVYLFVTLVMGLTEFETVLGGHMGELLILWVGVQYRVWMLVVFERNGYDR